MSEWKFGQHGIVCESSLQKTACKSFLKQNHKRTSLLSRPLARFLDAMRHEPQPQTSARTMADSAMDDDSQGNPTDVFFITLFEVDELREFGNIL